MPRFEEPEECVDGVVLVEVYLVEGMRWEVDVAGEGFDVGCCFAYSWLYASQTLCQIIGGTRSNLFVGYGHAFGHIGLDNGETLARGRKVLRRNGRSRS